MKEPGLNLEPGFCSVEEVGSCTSHWAQVEVPALALTDCSYSGVGLDLLCHSVWHSDL